MSEQSWNMNALKGGPEANSGELDLLVRILVTLFNKRPFGPSRAISPHVSGAILYEVRVLMALYNSMTIINAAVNSKAASAANDELIALMKKHFTSLVYHVNLAAEGMRLL